MNLPTAPKNFYAPTFATLKADLEKINGSTKGQLSLITAPPNNIETAWSQVGSGDHKHPLNRTGSLVVGVASLTGIRGPEQGPEEVIGEYGAKIQFDPIPEVEIKIDGSGATQATVIGIALLVGRDHLIDGDNNDVRYIAKIKDILVTDGGLISLPDWEIVISYAVIPVSGTPQGTIIAI